MKKIILYFMVFSLLTACKKKNADPEETPAISTIKPGSYFPVYPGSWWKYVNNKGDTVVHRASLDCQKDSYRVPGTPEYQSPEFYVPFYDQMPVWGSRIHKDVAMGYSPLVM